jgi:hypothetical protein
MARRREVCCLAAVMAACAGPVTLAADGSGKDQDKCDSWTATARMVAEAWLDDELPRHYAADTLAKAADKLDRIAACGNAGRQVSRLQSALAAGEGTAVRETLRIWGRPVDVGGPSRE